MVFWLNPSHIYSVDRKNHKNFKICIIIIRGIHTFMSFGVLGEYTQSLFTSSPCAQILSAYSLNTFKYFPHIRRRFCVPQITPICHVLHIRLNTFRILSKYAQILSAHSPQALKYLLHILQLSRKNEEQAERIFSLSTMLGDFKGTVFRKNGIGGNILAQDKQFTLFIFWLSLKQKLPYVYRENTLNGEISTESVYISVNNNTN